MFKYNQIITISKKTEKGELEPLYRFTTTDSDEVDFRIEATQWITRNIPYDDRDDIILEIENVENEEENWEGV